MLLLCEVLRLSAGPPIDSCPVILFDCMSLTALLDKSGANCGNTCAIENVSMRSNDYLRISKSCKEKSRDKSVRNFGRRSRKIILRPRR